MMTMMMIAFLEFKLSDGKMLDVVLPSAPDAPPISVNPASMGVFPVKKKNAFISAKRVFSVNTYA